MSAKRALRCRTNVRRGQHAFNQVRSPSRSFSIDGVYAASNKRTAPRWMKLNTASKEITVTSESVNQISAALNAIPLWASAKTARPAKHPSTPPTTIQIITLNIEHPMS